MLDTIYTWFYTILTAPLRVGIHSVLQMKNKKETLNSKKLGEFLMTSP